VVESNGKLKFMPKSSKPVTIIPYDKLLILGSGASRGSSFSLHNKPSAELPQRLSINYADSNSDYQTSTQSAIRISNSQHSQVVEIPLVLESSQAQQLADCLLQDIWQSKETYQFALGIECLFLEPGDVIQLQTNAVTYTLTITQLEVGNGQVHLQGLKVEASESQP
jgi:predicted phage tail protein